jgi:hypothetical protein
LAAFDCWVDGMADWRVDCMADWRVDRMRHGRGIQNLPLSLEPILLRRTLRAAPGLPEPVRQFANGATLILLEGLRSHGGNLERGTAVG